MALFVAWEALDAIGAAPPDLVLCSASLRAGSTLVYRLLWDAHPELESKFALIVPPDAVPPHGLGRGAVEKPVTIDVVRALLDRMTASEEH